MTKENSCKLGKKELMAVSRDVNSFPVHAKLVLRLLSPEALNSITVCVVAELFKINKSNSCQLKNLHM